MSSVLRLAVLFILLGQGAVAAAADLDAGKAIAATCVACHGPAGISPNDLWPNLAGQKESYMIKQINAFKDGSRIEPLMVPMVAPLSKRDIKDVAAYFASLKPGEQALADTSN